jgi:TonB family protein
VIWVRRFVIRRFAVLVLLGVSLPDPARAADTAGAFPSPAELPDPGSITAPVLTHFEQVPYPAEAAEQRLEGEVVLLLDIDESGRVTSATVKEGAGHGFDEAARSAALRFIFRPAARHEQPVKCRILYRYSFHLQPPPSEPPRAASARGAQSHLRGRITVSGTKSPLAGSRLQVWLGGKLIVERSSDADGQFDAGSLPAGMYRVSIEAPGFDRYSAQEQLAESEDVELSYGLVPSATSTTTITVQGAHPTREVTRHAISRRELALIPGTSGDALRAIQNLPGVARAPSLSGLLVVRGNADQTTPVFVDGLWLSNIYHFGGLSSVVPTEMLDEINFYPGNFSVRYGRALAGVVDAHLRETRDDGRYHGLVQLDLIDARVMAEGPVPLANGWNFIGGFRRSHVDAWLGPLLNGRNTYITAAPVYYDYQLIFDRRPGPSSYLRIGLLGFDDRFALIDKSSASGGKLDTINAAVGAGIIYKNRISETVNLDTTLSVARSHERFALSSSNIDLVAYATIGRGDIEWRLWPGAILRTGVDVLLAPYQAQGALPEAALPDAPAVGTAVSTPAQAFDRHALFFNPAAYGELDLRPSRRWQLVNGVRADYTLETQRLDVSPRMVARYALVATAPRTTLKAGSGLFQQAPDLIAMALKDPGTALRSQRSFQNSLGIEQELGKKLKLSLEGFYNLLDNLVSQHVGARGLIDYDNYGKGRIFGSELMLRYAADEKFFGWVSYTLSRSERTWVPGQPSHLFDLDQTHIFTALGSYAVGRGWELGLRFRYVTGNLYTPCSAAIFNAAGTNYTCIPAPVNSQRLPAFHQLDLRVDKKFVFSSFSLSAYLDLINVYNRKNPDTIQFNYDYSQSQPQSASLPFVPSLGIRGEM